MKSSYGKKGLAGLAVVVLVLAGSLGVIYSFFPGVLLAVLYKQYETKAGVSAASVDVEGYTVPYYKGGKNEAIVLIHGFGDSKVSFVQMVEYLTPKFYVVLPEVPGFGDTSKDPNRKYSIRSQVETLHGAFKKIGLTRFILGGNSMGGHIAAAYALRYPEDVSHLILIDASGLKVDDDIPFRNSESRIESEADFDAYMQQVFVQPPVIPGPFKREFIREAAANFDWQNKIRTDIREGEDYDLKDRLKDIRVPTLILWGDKDVIVKLDVGSAYNKGINGSILQVFSNCGHSPQYERPKETADAILAFLNSK
jgi:abhydrolase domain-containing protein 6